MKTLRILRYLLFCAFMLLIVSCNEEYGEGIIITDKDISLNLYNILHFSEDAGTADNAARSNTNDFRIEGMPDWLTSELTINDGYYTYTIGAKNNSTTHPRHAMLTYVADGFYKKYQDVYQECGNFVYNTSYYCLKGVVYSSPAGDCHTISLDTNVPWENLRFYSELPPTWYSVFIDTEYRQIVITTQPNTSGSPRGNENAIFYHTPWNEKEYYAILWFSVIQK